MAFTLFVMAVKSAAVFFAGTALSGVGFGSFQGGIRTVVPRVAEHERAGAVLLFTVAYLGLGVPAVAAGTLVVCTPA